MSPTQLRTFSFLIHHFFHAFNFISFSLKPDGGHTSFNVKLEGLPPNTLHGFHVHEKGDIYTNGKMPFYFTPCNGRARGGIVTISVIAP